MEQTPEQKEWQKRFLQQEERSEKKYRKMMEGLTGQFDFAKTCPFSKCRRARRCLSQQFADDQPVPGYQPKNHTADCIRMLSQTIMPACAALIWYDGLQDMVCDELYGKPPGWSG